MESSVSGVGVLDKSVAVLRAIETAGPMSLADLSCAVGLPRATTHRLAVALETHGLVRRDGDGRFALGLHLVALARAAVSQFPVAAAARPVLERLRDEVGESVQLYVREGHGRRCLVSLESPHGLRWIVPEGALLPLDRGSAGTVLSLASGSVEPWADSRADPWVESIEVCEFGVCSVSAAVRGRSGEVVAAVSVSGPVERFGRDPGQRHGPAVSRAAHAITSLVVPG